MKNAIKGLIWENKESIIAFIKGVFKSKDNGESKQEVVMPSKTGNKWGKTSLANIAKLPPENKIRRFLEFSEEYLPASTVTDTLRTAEEQNKKFREKASKLDGYTNKSNHQLMLAFDIVPYPAGWNATVNDWVKLHARIHLCLFLFNLNEDEELVLDWGGFWNTSKTTIGWDNAHYEVSKK